MFSSRSNEFCRFGFSRTLCDAMDWVFTEFLLNSTGFLPGFVRFYWVYVGFTEFY